MKRNFRENVYLDSKEEGLLRELSEKNNISKSSMIGRAITFYYDNYRNQTNNKINEILANQKEIEKALKTIYNQNKNYDEDIIKYLCALWLGLRIKDLPTDEATNISLREFQQRLISSHNSLNNSSTNANNQQQNVETLDINRG